MLSGSGARILLCPPLKAGTLFPSTVIQWQSFHTYCKFVRSIKSLLNLIKIVFAHDLIVEFTTTPITIHTIRTARYLLWTLTELFHNFAVCTPAQVEHQPVHWNLVSTFRFCNTCAYVMVVRNNVAFTESQDDKNHISRNRCRARRCNRSPTWL